MSDKFQWGPANPHPLSQMRTELVWDGKYDEYGRRREMDVASHAMPLQRIETVDEPRSRAAAAGQLTMFDREMAKRRDDFRNRLVWGDNKLVMASLLKEFKGSINLIYIDPPFDVGADFTMDVPIGDGKETVEKDQSTLEMVAYRDMWGKDTNSYLHMLSERLALMKDLLSERGTIYVHVGWQVTGSVRLLLNEVFGSERFLNEITWQRSSAHNDAKRFGIIHDTIFIYSKSDNWTFNPIFTDYDEDYVNERFRSIEEGTQRRYWLNTMTAAGAGSAKSFRGRVLPPPPGTHWRYSQEKIDQYVEEGRIVFTDSGMPYVKQYLDESLGRPAQSIWPDLVPTKSGSELLGYATQKPERLLERVVEASSGEGDLIADFFCGSGTTGAVAERLGRRWIMADLGRFSIHTSRKRLIELQRTLHAEGKPYRAFDVYNLGRYERQWWQKDRLQGAEEEHRRVVLEFFKAEILANAPSPLLHGRKTGAFCFVEGIDSIFGREEARGVAEAVAQAGGREVYCLAWEFEMDLRLHTAAIERELGVRMKLIPIPREIMEKNRKSPPPFLEMAVLETETVRRKQSGKTLVDVKLVKFLPSLSEVPSKELEALKERAVKSGFDFIDFWAVDFDWRPGQPFNHHWQDYRTRKDRSLKTVSDAGHEYVERGTRTVCVKVVDVFGCDTSVTVDIEV